MANTKKKDVVVEEEVFTATSSEPCNYSEHVEDEHNNAQSSSPTSCDYPIVSYDTQQINPGYWNIVSCCDGISTYVSNNESGCLVLVNCFGNITMQYVDKGKYDYEKGSICRMV